MSEQPGDSLEPDDGNDAADDAQVERERAEIREFVKRLNADDIATGGWFAKLLSEGLSSYTEKVDWQYFQEKYEGVPADVIVDQRIKMAARYAAIGGGLSASAYTGAIAATIGSGGGASPIAVPAAGATVLVDVVHITRLQLRLAYDIAVLYRVPLDVSDPDDLWKLIKVAFTIKSGEFVREGVVKYVPLLARPLIKRYYSKGVLAAAKSLPIVGKHLLQRNLIKIGIPLVGVPLAVMVNRYTTRLAGQHARAVFRNEARVIEVASRLSEDSRHPKLLLWIAWLVVNADGKISDEEALLLRHLVRRVQERHEVVDEDLVNVVDVDPAHVFALIADSTDDMDDITRAALLIAGIDGDVNSRERKLLAEIAERCETSRSRPDDDLP